MINKHMTEFNKEAITHTTLLIELYIECQNNPPINKGTNYNLSNIKLFRETQNEFNIEFSDISIAYLVIRDLTKLDIPLEYAVIKYMGAYVVNDTFKKSASIKAKSFGLSTLSQLSVISNVPLRTLRDWFVSRPITFHALLEFAVKTKIYSETHDHNIYKDTMIELTNYA